MKRGVWTKDKETFKSSYEVVGGERMFVLTNDNETLQDRRKVFESHEKAKSAGYKIKKRAK